MLKAFGLGKKSKSKSKGFHKDPENAVEQYKSNVAANAEHGEGDFPTEPRSQAPMHEDDFGLPQARPAPSVSRNTSSDMRSDAKPLTARLPDYMADPNAVLQDAVPWRHGHVPDYTLANVKFKKEKSNEWPAGSLEDLVSNLVKNWEKEASYKTRLEDWRTINTKTYRFSCNGGVQYTADEMMEIGTYNALIQEAAFYSAKHTSFDDSHKIFRDAMPEGFPWEVTEVYSGPPVVAFKWRHWGKMTGKLVCPVGPETKLECLPTNQELELFGVCVAHMDSDLKLSSLEIFYDPHELMASLVDARNLSYSSKPGDKDQTIAHVNDSDFKKLAMGSSDMSDGDSFLSEDSSNASRPNAKHMIPPHMLQIDPQTAQNEQSKSVCRFGSGDSEMDNERQDSGHSVGEHYSQNGHQGGGNLAELKTWQQSMGKKAESSELSQQLPSDDNLLASMTDKPRKTPAASRCPFPHA